MRNGGRRRSLAGLLGAHAVLGALFPGVGGLGALQSWENTPTGELDVRTMKELDSMSR